MTVSVVAEAPAVDIEAKALVRRAVEAREAGERSSWDEADAYLALTERGWTQQRVAEQCGTKQQRVSKFTICARNYSVLSNRPAFWEAFSQVNSEKEKRHNHRAEGTGENEWYTPTEYVMAAREVMGGIDLDPATSDIAQQAIGASSYFTRADDGLTQEWHGRVWLNPPYSQPAIQEFIEKAVAERVAGRVSEAVILTHNYTDTAWFHHAATAATAICFTRGRIGFISPSGERASPTQGQAFFYMGGHPERFKEAFSEFGLVVIPL